MLRTFTCLLVFVLTISATSSAGLAQADLNARYQRLEQDWLAGRNDLRTLRELAVLARVDVVKAQVLLGIIARQPQTYLPVYRTLSRDERRAIFRKPNGRFGDRWLKVAALKSPLAALLARHDPDDWYAHSAALADAGLIEEAVGFAYIALNQSGNCFATMQALNHPALLPVTNGTLHRMGEVLIRGHLMMEAPEKADEVRVFLASLPPMTFQDSILTTKTAEIIRYKDMAQSADQIRTRGKALQHHPDLQPLVEILKQTCPQDTAYHLGVLFHLEGGMELRLKLLSPFAPIIPTKEWQQSARFEGGFFRQWPPETVRFSMLEALSPCFTQAVRTHW